MAEGHREILPVASLDELQRRKEIEEEMYSEIQLSLSNPEGLSGASRRELSGQLSITQREIARITNELYGMTEVAA